MSARRCSPTRLVEVGPDGAPRSVGPVCRRHGSRWNYAEGSCETQLVVERILDERARQFARYGTNLDKPDGAGPETRWLLPYTTDSAVAIEGELRADYIEYEEEAGRPTWVHLLREEVGEAFMEGDPGKRVVELLQVAALAACWAESIEERARRGHEN